MSRPTTAELSLLRSQPHRSNLYLSIYNPNTVLSAQVNNSIIEKNARVIAYDNSSGDWTNIKRGMTMYVGSSAGAKDKGSIYIRSATANEITVGENSHINWADDDHLTIIDFFQIWPLYPRYEHDGENLTVYKDYDIAYTNQNEILGSFVCMGSHFAGFLDNSSCDVYFSASGTTHVGGDTVSYHWEFPSGTPSSSTSHTPGNVTYGTVGHYTASLTVSGTSTGSVDSSYRHISIYDRPGEGSNIPIQKWNLESFVGDRNSGGYTARITIFENIASIVDGALVVIFSDDWYGSTQQSINGGQLNRNSIFFTGYILDGTIDFDYRTSTISFDVGSPSETMKIVEAFDMSLQDSTNPTADAANPDKGGDPWYYLVGLTMKTGLWQYLRWHSTVNLCTDVEYISDDFNLYAYEPDRTSLYDAVDTLMINAVAGKAVCNRYGKLNFEIDAEAIHNALTSIDLGITLTNADWIGTPNIVERTSNDISYMELGGLKWDGATINTYTPLLLSTPGDTPAYRGNNIRLSGFAFSSEAQAKNVAGNMFAHRNSKFPTMVLDIAGNYRNFDITPLESIQVSLDANDTFRGHTWSNKPFTLNRVEWITSSSQHFMRPNITLEEVTEGFQADVLDIPEIPPSEGFDQQPIQVPALPIWPEPISISIPSGGGYNQIITWMDTNKADPGNYRLELNEYVSCVFYATINGVYSFTPVISFAPVPSKPANADLKHAAYHDYQGSYIDGYGRLGPSQYYVNYYEETDTQTMPLYDSRNAIYNTIQTITISMVKGSLVRLQFTNLDSQPVGFWYWHVNFNYLDYV